ncbi:hypothetical protein FC52_GL000835 [Lactobacillus pasteurii DSM 23907 = CRBIP 24.76]|uniref:Immunity protein PlnI n=1 Tax=Lactobacillus pasteurii DSM 23907 = CRBIP 24.76 TaxID=1423790 RepID=I7LAU6_9LACO|nr:CPBP family intramembrane glutamic endopeptidase [Lactobacillus pasteurii]KRK07286.1 hypothetical protein FC52_GL000835 [Lactobacillus pasteurii DSM 23907 = CRBIP 24.76]TDG78398.1 hypothetical protein C5L33_000996 [Lactobacillus pasteurii]CCI84981.1 Immunity protein PlnI [Lactobacillus pasteurii DSM 23907 = CRBIP 24.76]
MLEQRSQKILSWQFLLTAVIAGLLAIKQNMVINIIYFFVAILAYGLLKKGNKKLSQIWDIIAIPYVLIHVYTELFALLLNVSSLFYFLYFVVMLACLIPVTISDYGNIHKPLMQIISSVWIIINLFLAPQPVVHANAFIIGLNKSQLLLGLMFVIYGYFAITNWGYKFYLNLHIKNKNFAYFLVLLVTAGIILWISFINAFASSALTWSDALWNWNFAFINPAESAQIPNIWQLVFTSVNAGLMEEVARYVFVIALLASLVKKRNHSLIAIVLSSAIFSLLHVLSFSSTDFNLGEVVFKIIHAFGFGCIFGLLFLYTGKIWLIILLHSFADFISFSLTPLGYGGMLMTSVNNMVIFLAIITIVPLLFTILILMVPSAKEVIDRNIEQLLLKL